MRIRRCHFCHGARFLDCYICDGTGDDCPLCVGGKAPCGCAKDVQDGNHAYAEYVVSRLGVIWLGAHWRCRRIHAAVERAADVLAGSTDRKVTLGILVGTYVAGRHVWFPYDAAELVAAGLLIEDGPVERFTDDRRWYRPVDRPTRHRLTDAGVAAKESAR
jgi:hypothetical protein